MKINEFKSRPNSHQTHWEDLVLLGADGLDELNDKIEKFIARLDNHATGINLTTKIDGAPAVVCWSKFEDYPDNSICLKSFLTSNKNCISTEEEIEDRYGDRPNMAVKLKYCLEIAKHIPQGEAWQGDCLYSSSDLNKVEIGGTEYLTFHPNKIVYAFSENNPSYHTIEDSSFGICFHTIYKGNLEHKTQSFSVDATRLSDLPDGIYVMSPSLNVPQDSSLYNIDEVKKEYEELKSLENKLRVPEYEELCNNSKIMGFWNTFENHAISDNKTTKINPETFYDEFKDWVKSKVPQNRNFEKNLNTYYEFIDNNKELIYDMVACLNKAVDIKMNLWGGLKQAKQDYSTFYKHREQGYIPASMEGVAYSDADGNIVKIVDRSSFSNVNRDSNYMSGFEH